MITFEDINFDLELCKARDEKINWLNDEFNIQPSRKHKEIRKASTKVNL